MSQKKLSEYIDALDGITYPQWVKLREGLICSLIFPEESWKKICRSLLEKRRNLSARHFGEASVK